MAMRFSPPGSVDDLSPDGRDRWSEDLGDLIAASRKGNAKVPNDSPRPQFFNPLDTPEAPDRTTAVLRWGAFPRKLTRLPAPERWIRGESRDDQEEYCEWSADRDEQGRITAAYFTTEVPSYFHLLADDGADHMRLLEVYRERVSEDVQLKDLITPSNQYKPRNRWNRARAMHMIQGANTLPAAVLLVAQSTIVRRSEQGTLSNANELIRCGVNADPDRNSDPLIVAEINRLARRGASISFADPVGLYLDGLRTDGWATPDGADPQAFWKVTRGDDEHALRAVYSVSENRKYTVSDITIDGQPIVSPSQIAEAVTVKVVAIAQSFGKSNAVPRGCADEQAAGPALAGPQRRSIAELVAEAQATR